MARLVVLVVLAAVALSACAAPSSLGLSPDALWPPVQSVSCGDTTTAQQVSSSFTVTTTSTNATVLALTQQYQGVIRASAVGGGDALTSASVAVVTTGMHADEYNVTLAPKAKAFVVSAGSVRAVSYALETVAQLLEGGALNCSSVSVRDWPVLAHRGLAVDVASRYFPMPMLHDIVDGMQAAKLNTLNLHFGDYTGFRIYSDAYTTITDALNGYYRHRYITPLIAYAAARGIDIVPQVDLPARADGFSVVDDVEFCRNAGHALNGTNATLQAVGKWLTDVDLLFPDARIHLGGSNMTITSTSTNATKCTTETNVAVLQALVAHAMGDKKQVSLWQTAVDAANGSTAYGSVTTYVTDPNFAPYLANGTVVLAGGHASGNNGTLVLPGVTPSATQNALAGYINFTAKLSAEQIKNFTGVSASFFSTEYCKSPLCGGGPAPQPIASWLQSRFQDEPFESSVMQLIFPTVASMAGAAWNYENKTVAELTASIVAFTKRVSSRGVKACPTSCTCTALKGCKAYTPLPTDGKIVGVGFVFGIVVATLVAVAVLITEVRFYKARRSDSYELLN